MSPRERDLIAAARADFEDPIVVRRRGFETELELTPYGRQWVEDFALELELEKKAQRALDAWREAVQPLRDANDAADA